MLLSLYTTIGPVHKKPPLHKGWHKAHNIIKYLNISTCLLFGTQMTCAMRCGNSYLYILPKARLIYWSTALGAVLKSKCDLMIRHILGWIRNFLIGRSQRVVINSAKSEWAPVTSGIPQGSVLGPVLFIIYVNDLPDIIHSSIQMFADDTKVFNKITC